MKGPLLSLKMRMVQRLCRQVAGLVARRVVCYAEYEKPFKAGEQIGFIKFGSRADLFLPLDTKINVKIGDKVVGSETIVAELTKRA
jgi:phosphatidylserine decarboxylase